MSETSGKMTREERLAAKLRENLRRRKSQARERDSGAQAPVIGTESPGGDAGPDTLPK